VVSVTGPYVRNLGFLDQSASYCTKKKRKRSRIKKKNEARYVCNRSLCIAYWQDSTTHMLLGTCKTRIEDM
jgi:hypothetical protein